MLTTDELTIATTFVDYPKRGDLPARNEYYAKIAELEHQWAEYLADEYASDLPAAVAAQVYIRAWSDGHSAGYNEVEGHYNTYAEFARTVITASQK